MRLFLEAFDEWVDCLQVSISSAAMRVHLVTYASGRFRHRQLLLGWAARSYGVVETVTNWTPAKLGSAGFFNACKGIQLRERGSGFWAWKPFIILETLKHAAPGDLVFYCDVGRRFPYKVLNRSLLPFATWMEEHDQDFLPGLSIPWRGPMSVWTKRDAFVGTGQDTACAHQMAPIQASFSLWRASARSLKFLAMWQEFCSHRQMISDDPSICGLPELPDFFEHRHDQSLLTLCCLREGIRGLSMPAQAVPYDSRDPSEVLKHVFGEPQIEASPVGCFVCVLISVTEKFEIILRRCIRFGESAKQHPLAD